MESIKFNNHTVSLQGYIDGKWVFYIDTILVSFVNFSQVDSYLHNLNTNNESDNK